MRQFLYPIIAVLALAVLFVDHYTVNNYLSDFEEARNYNLAEMVQAYQMQDIALASQGLQEIVLITNRRVEKTEQQNLKLGDYIRQLNATNKQQEAVVISAAGTIKDLTEDNARIQQALDDVSRQLETAIRELESTKKELNKLKESKLEVK
jgi:uncharacterized protein YaiI (UPF0178 family)